MPAMVRFFQRARTISARLIAENLDQPFDPVIPPRRAGFRLRLASILQEVVHHEHNTLRGLVSLSKQTLFPLVSSFLEETSG